MAAPGLRPNLRCGGLIFSASKCTGGLCPRGAVGEAGASSCSPPEPGEPRVALREEGKGAFLRPRLRVCPAEAWEAAMPCAGSAVCPPRLRLRSLSRPPGLGARPGPSLPRSRPASSWPLARLLRGLHSEGACCPGSSRCPRPCRRARRGRLEAGDVGCSRSLRVWGKPGSPRAQARSFRSSERPRPFAELSYWINPVTRGHCPCGSLRAQLLGPSVVSQSTSS